MGPYTFLGGEWLMLYMPLYAEASACGIATHKFL
jgi:hypothetical protein